MTSTEFPELNRHRSAAGKAAGKSLADTMDAEAQAKLPLPLDVFQCPTCKGERKVQIHNPGACPACGQYVDSENCGECRGVGLVYRARVVHPKGEKT